MGRVSKEQASTQLNERSGKNVQKGWVAQRRRREKGGEQRRGEERSRWRDREGGRRKGRNVTGRTDASARPEAQAESKEGTHPRDPSNCAKPVRRLSIFADSGSPTKHGTTRRTSKGHRIGPSPFHPNRTASYSACNIKRLVDVDGFNIKCSIRSVQCRRYPEVSLIDAWCGVQKRFPPMYKSGIAAGRVTRLQYPWTVRSTLR